MNPKIATKTDSYIHDEFQFGAHNYHPLPVVLTRGEGIYVWDVEGKKYVDFLSAYSAVNQGHSNPTIIKALTKQSQQLSLTSRAFHNDQFSEFAKLATSYFAFDMPICQYCRNRINSSSQGLTKNQNIWSRISIFLLHA